MDGSMRKLAFFLLAVVIVVVLAVGTLLLVPLDSFRAPLETAITRGIGRGVHIAGSMHVSLYPEIGISASDVSIDNLAGGKAREFARVDTLAVGAKLIPLLFLKLLNLLCCGAITF